MNKAETIITGVDGTSKKKKLLSIDFNCVDGSKKVAWKLHEIDRVRKMLGKLLIQFNRQHIENDRKNTRTNKK